MKGLRVEIYRASYRSPQCTLGSVTEATVVGIPGAELFEATPEAPAIKLVHREVYGRRIVHAEPLEKPKGLCGPMAGGSYVATSDSRFSAAAGIYGAVSLHDYFDNDRFPD